jgi:hypothetical protein
MEGGNREFLARFQENPYSTDYFCKRRIPLETPPAISLCYSGV